MAVLGLIIVIAVTIFWATNLGPLGLRTAIYLVGFGIALALAHWPVSMLLGDSFLEVLALRHLKIAYVPLMAFAYPAMLIGVGGLGYSLFKSQKTSKN